MVLKIQSVLSSSLTRWLDSKLWLRKSVVCIAARKCLPACHCGFCPVTSPIGFKRGIRSSIRSMSSTNYSSVDKEMIPETEVRQVELPNEVEDLYGGVTLSVEQSMDPTVFLNLLRVSLSKWKQQGKKGIWIKLPLEQASLVEVTVKEGFKYHHAEPDYLMLVKWISDAPDTIPINASHRVGIGAFVMNSNREEKSGAFKGTGVWKLPTGVVDEGEDICVAAIREVKEETGIDAEFVEVLAFRQSHKSFFGKSDLFFLCMLRPCSYDIQMQDSELEAAQLEQKGIGPGARSSHAITVVGPKAYAFGGEFSPRVPVDKHLYIFDLETRSWSVADVTGDIPPPRVGVTMTSVGDTIYVFGGRDGTHKELNELYSFDTSTNKWTLLSSGNTGPAHRSYHSTAADDRHVYIFGGCGVAGRLNDLWAYDVVDKKWVEHPRPGESCKGRGGPGLVSGGGKIWVVYGFSGMEMDDVHVFDPASGEWAEVETAGEKPTGRSVFCTVGVGKYVIIYGGEVDPSDLGHMGAGRFSGEVYGLETERLEWTKWEDRVGLGGNHPGARGWCAFSGGRVDGKEGLLVYGGNSPTNDRLGDIFFFSPNCEVLSMDLLKL